jgi:tRNA(Ile)-lysidine synthase
MSGLVVETEPGLYALPGGVIFEAVGNEVSLRVKGGMRAKEASLLGEHTINVPGEARLDEWRVRCEFVAPDAYVPSGKYVSCLDYDSLGRCLVVRGRRPGDKFQPLGLAQPKKLQDFMVDQKIPSWKRDSVPLLASERGIAWIVGYRIAHWARITPGTTRAVRVEFIPSG